MAGINVGMGSWGNFRGRPEMKFNIPKPPVTPSATESPTPGVDAGPSTPPPRWSKFGGMLANQDVFPSAMDPFRTYGTVSGGKMTPPQNPYGQNQPIRFTPGGEYGQGPVNTGPSNMPNAQDYMNRGGFTGGQMPPNSNAGGQGIWNPPMPPEGQSPYGFEPNYNKPDQANIPNMRPKGMMPRGSLSGLRGAYNSNFRF